MGVAPSIRAILNGFLEISETELPMERSFFETSCGKNVCDGLGAIVKNSCFYAMLTGKVIANAHEVYAYSQEMLSHGDKGSSPMTVSRNNFIFAEKVSIIRSPSSLMNLTGTRKLHAVRNTDRKNILETRNLSCFCDSCTTGQGECSNREYVQLWEERKLKFTKETDSSCEFQL